jgi:arylsulfatase A-like enzyme
MKYSYAAGIALAVVFAVGILQLHPVAAADRPNIVVILTDDQGYADVGFRGTGDVKTPALDRLTAEGVRFDNAYANCPVCSPTRAALLTGCYPDIVGVPGVIRTHAESSWGFLDPQAPLLPAVLKEAGYHTAIIGKWHLGLTEPNTPLSRGFDHFHGFLGDMMDDYNNHRRHGVNYMRKNRETITPEGHATDLFTDWAIDYLQSRVDAPEPFFLYLAYNAPHTPIQPPEEFVQRIRQRHPDLSPTRAKLVAFIEHMDQGIGRVLDALDETKLAEKTLVIFASDNGGDIRPGANNKPWRDGKGTMYEGGIRVPMSARWPGKIEAGSTDRIALSMDIFPTVCEAAGVEPPSTIDGVSFLPTLLGKEQPSEDRTLIWVRREGNQFEGQDWYAVRQGDWKLVQPSPFARPELYDLANDPGETQDLREQQPRMYNTLTRAWRAHVQRAGQVPWQQPERGAATE